MDAQSPGETDPAQTYLRYWRDVGESEPQYGAVKESAPLWKFAPKGVAVENFLRLSTVDFCRSIGIEPPLWQDDDGDDDDEDDEDEEEEDDRQ